MNTSSHKTKILFVITKSNFGGAQKYVYDLATNIPKDKFNVVVATGGTGILIQKLHEQNIRVLPILSLTRDVKVGNDFKAFFELWSIFRNERPDVVHLNSAKAGGVGALAARLAGVPRIIFTAHGWAFNEERSTLQRLFIKFFSWMTTLLSHKTIAVSLAVKNDTRKWLFAQKKIIVVRNGVSDTKFYDREEAREKLFSQTSITLPSNAFLLCTIAELHNNKGLQYSIKAFAELAKENTSLHYFIFGDGEEKEHLDTLIRSLGMEGRAHLLGFTKGASTFLRAFDLFILPSITEGLGFVILEAGCAGIPVIASRVGGIPEIIDDGRTGILIPLRNTPAISSAIKSLIDDPLLRAKLGTALQEKVLQDFSLSRMVKQTIILYTK